MTEEKGQEELQEAGKTEIVFKAPHIIFLIALLQISNGLLGVPYETMVNSGILLLGSLFIMQLIVLEIQFIGWIAMWLYARGKRKKQEAELPSSPEGNARLEALD